jgi:hypothetical protein
MPRQVWLPDLGEPSLGVDAVELGALGQGVDGGRPR